MFNLILLSFAYFIGTVALAVLFIYIRYRYYKSRVRDQFYTEASAILEQRGQSLTSVHKRNLNKMLDQSEEAFIFGEPQDLTTGGKPTFNME
jgi:cbb3-type cytochrome oxidase subunit 3